MRGKGRPPAGVMHGSLFLWVNPSHPFLVVSDMRAFFFTEVTTNQRSFPSSRTRKERERMEKSGQSAFKVP